MDRKNKFGENSDVLAQKKDKPKKKASKKFTWSSNRNMWRFKKAIMAFAAEDTNLSEICSNAKGAVGKDYNCQMGVNCSEMTSNECGNNDHICSECPTRLGNKKTPSKI